METVALLLVQLSYAMTYPVTGQLLKSLDPLYWTVLRASLSALLLTVLLKARGGRIFGGRMAWRDLLFLSFAGVSGNQAFFILGLARSTPTEAALLVTLIPVWVYLGSILIGQERFQIRRTCGLLVAVAGVFVLYGRPGGSVNVFNLLNSFVYSSYLIFVWRHMRRMSPLELVTPLFILGAIEITIFATVASLLGWAHPETLAILKLPSSWRVVATLVTVGTVFPYLLNSFAARRLSAPVIAIGITLQPLLTAIIDHTFYGRAHDIGLAYAGALIFTGVTLAAWKTQPQPIEESLAA